MADTDNKEQTSVPINVVNNPPIDGLLKPFQKFFNTEASGGIILLIMTVIAIVWANSPWGSSYTNLWNMHFSVSIGGSSLDKPLIIWINDLLMAIFFFVVGLEIKRELVIGELSSLKQASFPIIAAIGGMIVPAVIYYFFNRNDVSVTGWGIPMATDIAFAIGILALLGDKVPFSLKVFLTALAIVDDLGAVLVIALFYTSSISFISLAIGGGMILLLIIANRLHIRNPIVYTVLGIVLWAAFLKSGIHPTIAGVILAFTIPVKASINTNLFVIESKALINSIEQAGTGDLVPTTKEFNSNVLELESLCEMIQSPMQRIEHKLHYWVAFVIMPVFALANAGLAIQPALVYGALNKVSIGIVLGLVLGKQIGITLFSWLSVKLNLSELPNQVSWMHIYGVSCLGGIGFTMSLFIASLAFTNNAFTEESKLGILCASLISGIMGILILRKVVSKENR